MARVEGDYVEVYPPYTPSGVSHSGYVSAIGTATIVITNNTGSPVDLGSGTWRVRVVHKETI